MCVCEVRKRLRKLATSITKIQTSYEVSGNSNVKIRDLDDRMRVKDTLINFLEQDREHNYSWEEKDQMLSEARKELELLDENKTAMLALKQDYFVAKANADADAGRGRRGGGR